MDIIHIFLARYHRCDYATVPSNVVNIVLT